MRSMLLISSFSCAHSRSVRRPRLPNAPANPATQTATAPAAPPTVRVGTMSELMVHMIYPTSDAVFYISSRTPKTDAEWASCRRRR